MIGVAVIASVEHGSRSDDLALLVTIHCVAGLREIRCAPEAYLDKCQAMVVQHDQVNFAAAASKVACDRSQALLDEIPESRVFRAVA